MRILVSNDDGFHAEGIQVLATELRKIAEVIVVAPDRNRSAASSSLTLVGATAPTPFRQWRLLCEWYASRLCAFSIKRIFIWPSRFSGIGH